MSLPYQSWQNGDAVANGEEFTPIDDAGRETTHPEAEAVAERFREALDDLDQFDAFCRDFEENWVRLKIESLAGAIKARLKEVSNG